MNALECLNAPFCARLALSLAHFLWEGAVIALAAWVAAAALRRHSSRARYGVYCLALGLMVCALVGTILLVEPPRSRDAAAPRISRRAPALPAFTAAPSEERALTPRPFPSERNIPQGENTGVSPQGAGGAMKSRWESISAPLTRWWGAAWPVCAPCVSGVYLAGVLAMMLRLVAGLGGSGRLRRLSQPVDDAGILQSLARQAQALGLHFTPPIAFCRRAVVPTVVGVLRPTVLLPFTFVTGLSADQIEMLLAHELAHVRRWDPLVNVAQRLIEALLFFHPAMWFISRRIRIERELCCDDLVVALGGKPLEYASSLVETASRVRPSARPAFLPAEGLNAAASAAQLKSRVKRLLGAPEHEALRISRAWVVLCCIAAVVLLAGVLSSGRTPAGKDPLSSGSLTNPLPDDTAWGVAVDGIRCALAPLRSGFTAGEDIALDLLYLNASNKPITVCVHPDPFFIWTFLEIRNERGQRVAVGPHANGLRRGLILSDFVTLAPGETASVRYDLPRGRMGRPQLEPGTYFASAELNKINGMEKCIHGYEAFCRENGLKPWTGLIGSGPAKLTIVPMPEIAWGETVEGLRVGVGAPEITATSITLSIFLRNTRNDDTNSFAGANFDLEMDGRPYAHRQWARMNASGETVYSGQIRGPIRLLLSDYVAEADRDNPRTAPRPLANLSAGKHRIRVTYVGRNGQPRIAAPEQVATLPKGRSAPVEVEVGAPADPVTTDTLKAALEGIRARKTLLESKPLRIEYKRTQQGKSLKEPQIYDCVFLGHNGNYRETETDTKGKVTERYLYRGLRMTIQRRAPGQLSQNAPQGDNSTPDSVEYHPYPFMHWADLTIAREISGQGESQLEHLETFPGKSLPNSRFEEAGGIRCLRFARPFEPNVAYFFAPDLGWTLVGVGSGNDTASFKARDFKRVQDFYFPMRMDWLGETTEIRKVEVLDDPAKVDADVAPPATFPEGTDVLAHVPVWRSDYTTTEGCRTTSGGARPFTWKKDLPPREKRWLTVAASEFYFPAFQKAMDSAFPLPFYDDKRDLIVWAKYDRDLEHYLVVHEGDALPERFGKTPWTVSLDPRVITNPDGTDPTTSETAKAPVKPEDNKQASAGQPPDEIATLSGACFDYLPEHGGQWPESLDALRGSLPAGFPLDKYAYTHPVRSRGSLDKEVIAIYPKYDKWPGRMFVIFSDTRSTEWVFGEELFVLALSSPDGGFPGSLDTMQRCIQRSIARWDFARAIPAAEALLKTANDDAARGRCHLLLAQAYFVWGVEYRDAVARDKGRRHLEQAFALNPALKNELGVARQRAYLLTYRQGKVEGSRAVAEAQKEIAAAPRDAQAHFYLGMVHHVLATEPDFAYTKPEQDEERRLALESMAKAVELDPKRYEYWAYYVSALAYAGQKEEAKQAADRMMKEADLSQEKIPPSATCAYEIMSALMETEEGYAYTRAQAARDPSYAPLQFVAAERNDEKDPVRYKMLTDLAARIASGDLYLPPWQTRLEVQTLYKLGTLHCQAGKIEKALDVYERIIRLSPYYAQVRFNRGNVYRVLAGRADTPEEKKRFLEEAKEDFEAALQYPWHDRVADARQYLDKTVKDLETLRARSPAKPAETASAPVGADSKWGSAVEGVQVRLKTERSVWKAGEHPVFKIDLKSEKERVLPHYGPPLDEFDVRLDGVWYRRNESGERQENLRSVGPSPGTSRENEHFLLRPDFWCRSDDKMTTMPPLAPGKHTLEVALPLASADRATSQPLRAVSNPVEIEIVEKPVSLLRQINDVLRKVRGAGTDFDAREKELLALLNDYTDPKDIGVIYAACAEIHYGTGSTHFDRVVKYARKSLEYPLDLETRMMACMRWGEGLQLQGGGAAPDLPRQPREEIVKPFLRAIRLTLDAGIPEEPVAVPKLTATRVGGGMVGLDPDVEKRMKEEYNAQIGAVEKASRTNKIIMLRNFHEEKVFSLYSQKPLATEELRQIATEIIGNPAVVNHLIAGVNERIEEQGWGEAVSGVQIRLRDAKPVRGDGATSPVLLLLKTEAANTGNLILHLAENGNNCQVEVDGQWYMWFPDSDLQRIGEVKRDGDGAGKGSALLDFGGGKRYTDLSVTIGSRHWRALPAGRAEEIAALQWGNTFRAYRSEDIGAAMRLAPGKRRVRVAYNCGSARAGQDIGSVRAVSNPLEIEVGSPTASAASGEPADKATTGSLADLPEFRDLDTSVTEKTLKRMIAEKGLRSFWTLKDRVTKTYDHHVYRSDGENVVVTFRDGKCSGIRRMRKDASYAYRLFNGLGKQAESLRVTLRADKKVWKPGEDLALKADVRNAGQEDVAIYISGYDDWEIELDGQWYWPIGATTALPVVLAPGEEVLDISVPPTWIKISPLDWHAKSDDDPVPGLGKLLTLEPGRHTVRVATYPVMYSVDAEGRPLTITPSPGSTRRVVMGEQPIPGKPVRAVSNPIEIEVVAPAAAPPPRHPGNPSAPAQKLGDLSFVDRINRIHKTNG